MAKDERYINSKYYTDDKSGKTYAANVSRAYGFFQVKPDRVRQRKPKGILPPKPYAFEERSWRPDYFEEIITVGTSTRRYGHNQQGYNLMYRPFPSGLENQAVIQALAKLKDQRINLGVAMAEAQKTADMLGSISSRIARGYRALRKKDPKGAARALGFTDKGAIPNQWLEYQYGITPLLQDLKGGWDELQRQQGWSWVTTVRAERRSEERILQEYGGYLGTIDTKWDHRCAVSLSYRPRQYALQSIARTGLSNPAEILWELVPFSFVVDWMYPVGDALHALDATVGYEFLHGSCTKFTRGVGHVVPKWGPTSMGRLAMVSPGVGKSVKFNRTVYASSPLPRPPSLKNPLSLGHMANGLSLLASIFGGKRR